MQLSRTSVHIVTWQVQPRANFCLMHAAHCSIVLCAGFHDMVCTAGSALLSIVGIVSAASCCLPLTVSYSALLAVSVHTVNCLLVLHSPTHTVSAAQACLSLKPTCMNRIHHVHAVKLPASGCGILCVSLACMTPDALKQLTVCMCNGPWANQTQDLDLASQTP